MKKIFLSIASLFLCHTIYCQNIGIGLTTPKAFFNIAADKTVLFGSDTSGAGYRLMWLGSKAAFRAGWVIGTQWNALNIGFGSTAFGKDNIASGDNSFAAGQGCTASGNVSIALGLSNTASSDISIAIGAGASTSEFGIYGVALGTEAGVTGYGATAIGYHSESSGSYAMAIGNQSNASGNSSVAIGHTSFATGASALAVGYNNYSTGLRSVALGSQTVASGDYSVTIGSFVSSNNHTGSVLIGDRSTSTNMASPSDNNFRARFANGYRFYTSGDLSTSCSLGAGDNAWATNSDVRLKENFSVVDGESFLNKIALLPLSSWNYKKQDPSIFRHYGPMAQDFFAAFGKDEFGIIGNDTSINQADFLGVNLIAIQALEKRTRILTAANINLEQENRYFKTAIVEIQARLDKITATLQNPGRLAKDDNNR